MKTVKFFRAALILLGILLSACAAPANSSTPANAGGGKGLSDIVFTGMIESMNGDQWVINGQPVKVVSSVLQDGPFVVGDTVKVEASVGEDGSVTAQRVETPSAADLAVATSSTPDDSSSTPVPGSTPQAPVFDDSGTEAVGTVDAITDTSITLGGQTYLFASGIEIKGDIVSGALVKLHFIINGDGTLSVTEIEIADPSQIFGDNSNDDNSNGTSFGDDNSNDDNSNNNSNGNDDDSNDDNSNDDNGGNSNDDNGNDDNSNDSNSNG